MIMRNCIFILVLTFMLTGCTEKNKFPDIESTSGQSALKSPLHESSGIRIVPDNPTVETIITLRTENHFADGSKINWYINDIRDESSSGLNFSSDSLQKGDRVKAVIIRNEKEYESNEVTIRNTPPIIIIAQLLPEKPRLDSNLTVSIKANDVDDDTIHYRYKWTVNDKFAGERPYLNTELKSGDKVAVDVTPYDNNDSGKTVRRTKRILNSLPVFSESKPVFDGNTYTYQVKATDPDNDVLTFKLEKNPEGMTIDPSSGLITWNVTPKDKGYHDIQVRVTDSNGGALIIPFTTKIGFQ